MDPSQPSVQSLAFGDVLRRLRRTAGFTQEDLAERAGLSARGLSDLERGVNRSPRRETLLALAEALQLSPEDRTALEAARRRPAQNVATRALTPADPTAPGAIAPIHIFLIVDIRGYSTFTYAHTDEAAARLAMRFAHIAQEATEARGGQVVELRGDEALCVFTSARAALLAAVELQDRLAAESQADPTFPMPAGIGLDAGEAIPVAGGFRGHALNLAARLCGLARQGEILASETVINLARKVEGLEYADRGPVTLKGIAVPVRVLQVLPTQEPVQLVQPSDSTEAPPPSPAPAAAADQVAQQSLPLGGFLGALPETRLVAREDELATLLASLTAVQGGQGRMVVLVGEPGIGKTRLAQEVTVAARERGFLITTGRCYAPQEGVAYFPFVEVLGSAYDAAPAALRTMLLSRWSDVARLLPDPEVAQRAGLGQVVGGTEDQQRLFRQVTGFLEALAEIQPLALLLDDLHWADGASIGLLQHLARHTRASRLLLLATYRDADAPLSHPLSRAVRDLGREHLVERIDVRRLPPEGTAALVATTLGEGEVSDAVTALVHGPTEGNPFFAHEVLRTLMERGDVYHVDGRWERREGSDIAMPESVRGLIQDRVARLSEATQETLQYASVLGQTFAFDDLLAMQAQSGSGDRTEATLEAEIEAAVTAGLVHEAGRDDYTFSHALTQQALYVELSSRKKRRLHRAAAEAIERLEAQQRERRAGELAFHFLEAGEGERALPYALLAGDRAQAVYANAEAERHFRTALALARAHGNPAHEAEALERLAQLHWWTTGLYAGAIKLFEQTVAASETAGDVERQARACVRLARAYGRCGRSQQAIERLRPLLDVWASSGESEKSTGELAAGATLLTALADVSYHAGQYEQQQQAAERAAALARAMGQRGVLAEAENLGGIALGLLGRWEEAVRTLRQAVSQAEAVGDIYTCSHALRHLADCYERSGQFAEAEIVIARGLEYADRLGHLAQRGIMAYKRGLHSYYLGEWADARTWYERSAALFGESKGEYLPHVYSTGLYAQGHFHLFMGRSEAGSALLEEAIALSEQSGNLHILRRAQRELAEADLIGGHLEAARQRLEPLVADPERREHTDVLPLLPLLAWATIQLGEPDRAQAMLAEAAERAVAQHHQLALLDVQRGQALLAMREERWPEARAALEQALASCRAMPYLYAEAKLLYGYGQLHAEMGETERAHERLEAALAILNRLGERLYAEQVEGAIANVGSR